MEKFKFRLLATVKEKTDSMAPIAHNKTTGLEVKGPKTCMIKLPLLHIVQILPFFSGVAEMHVRHVKLEGNQSS